MKTPVRFLSYLSFATLLGSLALQAENWAQFRGPNASGISSDAEIPATWSATENMAWKVALPGPGSSSPIVWEDALFLTCYTGEGDSVQRHLIRFNAKSGEKIWQKTVDAKHPEDTYRGFITEHGYASNTPVTDGKHVYAFFGKAGVHAWDMDGNEVWSADVGGLSSQRQWGSASSPLLYKDLLIVPAGDEARAIIAYNKTTGEEVWKAEGDNMEHTYGSPILMEVDAERTDLIFALPNEIWGVNPDTGKLRWFAEYGIPGNMSNTVVLADNMVTVSGGFPSTLRIALEGGQKGDLSDQVLFESKTASYMTAPVFKDGVLYYIPDGGIPFATKPNENKPLWEERLRDLGSSFGRGKPFYASPVLADNGLIYATSRANGTFVIEPNPNELKVVAKNVIEGDETMFNGTPAISDGRLYLRSNSYLYCIAAAE